MTAKTAIVAGQQVAWPELCKQVLGPVTNVKAQRVGSLWGRYGSVTEVVADSEAQGTHRLIAKQVDPPRGSGASHERKLKSYLAEAAFYQHHAAQTAAVCAVAQPLLVDVSLPHHFFFLLTDLTEQFPQQLHSYSFKEARVALDWLASFHALWWEAVPGQQQPISHNAPMPTPTAATAAAAAVPDSLWDQGCYWHLDTRQEEYANMSSTWRDLRSVAADIDHVLKGLRADGSGKVHKHRTLVHGDFKSENVLFDDAGERCAAYDFQYCGEGYGVRDVAYMFASSLDEDVVQQQEEQLLRYYHMQLQQQLQHQGKAAAAQSYTYEIMKAHYELCLADYVRFMAGWGMWGNHRWASGRAKQVMQRLQEVVRVARSGW